MRRAVDGADEPWALEAAQGGPRARRSRRGDRYSHPPGFFRASSLAPAADSPLRGPKSQRAVVSLGLDPRVGERGNSTEQRGALPKEEVCRKQKTGWPHALRLWRGGCVPQPRLGLRCLPSTRSL